MPFASDERLAVNDHNRITTESPNLPGSSLLDGTLSCGLVIGRGITRPHVDRIFYDRILVALKTHHPQLWYSRSVCLLPGTAPAAMAA
jgi:hypothetical protein